MDNVVSIPVSLFTYSRFIESKQQLNMPDSSNDEFMLMLLDHITSCDIHINGSGQSNSGTSLSSAKQPDDVATTSGTLPAAASATVPTTIALVSPFSGNTETEPPTKPEVSDTGDSTFTCQMCGYACSEEKDFNLHIANHISQLSSIMAAQNPPQQQQPSPVRPPAPLQTPSMQSHQQQFHPTAQSAVSTSILERKYQCDICGARFKQQRILEQHIDGMHSTTGKYSCDSCGQTFKWPGKFYSHKRMCAGQASQQQQPPPLAASTGSVVNGLPPLHRCQKCDTLFVSLTSLAQHACTGSGGPPPLHQQPQQQQLHLQPQRQQQQMQSIVLVPPKDSAMADASLKQHPCPECNKRFRTKTLLDQHMHLHRPPAYQCRYCNRKFRWPPVFYQHQRQCKFNPAVLAASSTGGISGSRSHAGINNNSRRKSYTPVKASDSIPNILSTATVTKQESDAAAGLSQLRDQSSENSTSAIGNSLANYRCACTAVFASVQAYLNHCDACPEQNGRIHHDQQLQKKSEEHLEQRNEQQQLGLNSLVDAVALSQLAPSVAGGYTCPQCNNTYSSRLSLKQHIEGMHSVEARYECDGCRKRFRWGASYYCHKKTCNAYRSIRGGAESLHQRQQQAQPPPLQFSLARQSNNASNVDAELDNGDDDDDEEEYEEEDEEFDDETAMVEDADMAIDLTESGERRQQQQHRGEFDGSPTELQV